MLCLADDAGLARVAIGATSVPRAQRRRWLEDLAARLEGVSPTEPSPGARYTRAWRTREANGQVLLKVVVDEAALAALLVDRGLLDPLRADDRDALAVSAARLLAQLCEVSPHDEKLRDKLTTTLCLTALQSRNRLRSANRRDVPQHSAKKLALSPFNLGTG
jgi:hypothetical protein